LDGVINGDFDDYVEKWALAAKEMRSPILLRPWHEMNGNWFPYSGVFNGGGETTGYGDPTVPDGPERFVDAWRHIHEVFQRQGACNVYWVFSPNADSLPHEPWNSPVNYYPGDLYVDWIGSDGYNWGNTQWWSHWMSFEEIFDDDLRLLSESIDKPFMIAEFACTEEGGDKAAWIADAYSKMKDYPYIKAAIWFHVDKETNWRFDSSEASRQAFVSAISDRYYVDRVPQ